MFGGTWRPGEADPDEPFRVPSVRGALRFWWRAVHGHCFTTSRSLHEAEASLWGEAAGGPGRRSRVDLSIVRLSQPALPDDREPRDDQAYALFPARRERGGGWRRRLCPGAAFRLVARVAGDAEAETMVRRALCAWILFGGYGARTRRGLGSLYPLEDEGVWLPEAPTVEAFKRCLGYSP